MVMDPLDGNKIHHYQQSLNWDSASQKVTLTMWLK
jgi:hypothetical protein